MSQWSGQSSPATHANAQALIRIQQVLLSEGYEYIYGDEAAWPETAVMMAKGDSAVIVCPFPSPQLSGRLPLDKPTFALLLVGSCPANEIEGFAAAHAGNLAFYNPRAGQWLVQGSHALFDQHLLGLFSSREADERLGQYNCRSLLAQTRQNGPPRSKSLSHTPTATIALIGICVATYFLGGESLKHDWANYGPAVKAGEYWRLITCAFVHANEIHLLFNMMALWYFGRQVEVLQGWWRTVLFFFASVFLASVASLLVHDVLMHRVTYSVGASGGLFGLAGVIAGMVLRHRHELPPGVGRAMLRSIGVFLLYNLMFIIVPQIDVSAHGGGLVGGFLWALAISCPPMVFHPPSLTDKLLAILLGAAFVAAAAAVVYYLPMARV